MYIPELNKVEDQKEIFDFIKRFSFGTMITSENDIPVANHLPFHVEVTDGKLLLTSHMARANEQWKHLVDKNVLVTFSEPHAYISPSNYEKHETVPTWDYISVHVYGKVNLLEGYDSQIIVLEKMINQFDQGYQKQWTEISKEYKQKLAEELVAFELIPYDIQGKKKMSQNKSHTEKRNILSSLANGESRSGQLMAEYMKDEI